MIMQFIVNFVFQPRLIFNNILPRVDMLLKKYKYSFMFHMKVVLKKNSLFMKINRYLKQFIC